MRMRLENIDKEYGIYKKTILEVAQQHKQEEQLFLRTQINDAKKLNQSLVGHTTLTFKDLSDDYKQKLSEIKILPNVIRRPVVEDLPVLEIIKTINVAVAFAEAYLKTPINSL